MIVVEPGLLCDDDDEEDEEEAEDIDSGGVGQEGWCIVPAPAGSG